MSTLADRVSVGDARSKRVVKLSEIADDEPMHPQPLRVRRDSREWRLVYLFGEIEEAGQIVAARRYARESSNRSFERDRRLRDATFVGSAAIDESLERREQLANRLRLVAQAILDGPHRAQPYATLGDGFPSRTQPLSVLRREAAQMRLSRNRSPPR